MKATRFLLTNARENSILNTVENTINDLLKEAFCGYPCGTAQLYGNCKASFFEGGSRVQKNETMNILKKLIAFSVPLILSGLLQQLFNWVDALIVGNFVGEKAIGGVGATGSIYNFFVTVIVGFTSGLSVLFAQHYGRKQTNENKDLLAGYSVILTAVFAIVAIAGILLSENILKLMNTPEPLFGYAKEYLKIVLVGVPFLALYNTYSALLRGVGNSSVPFVAVVISSVVNGVLDFVFVAFLNCGVRGAAWATAVSQIAMTVFVVAYTATKYKELRFSPFEIGKYKKAVANGAKFGMPPAIQSSVSSVGNVILQKFMNGLGEHTVSAITTAYRVDTVLLLPIVNFGTAVATLVAQETGAGNEKNAKKILKLGTVVMAVLSGVLTLTILCTGEFLLRLFGLGEISVEIGVSFFRGISAFYIVYGLSMCVKGYLEGTGDMLFSGVIAISSLAVRVVCSYLFVGVWGNMVIAYAEAIAWVYLLLALMLRYVKKSRDKT